MINQQSPPFFLPVWIKCVISENAAPEELTQCSLIYPLRMFYASVGYAFPLDKTKKRQSEILTFLQTKSIQTTSSYKMTSNPQVLLQMFPSVDLPAIITTFACRVVINWKCHRPCNHIGIAPQTSWQIVARDYEITWNKRIQSVSYCISHIKVGSFAYDVG